MQYDRHVHDGKITGYTCQTFWMCDSCETILRKSEHEYCPNCSDQFHGDNPDAFCEDILERADEDCLNLTEEEVNELTEHIVYRNPNSQNSGSEIGASTLL
jgi:hypothetical protein